ncbi:oxygenase MpaB family protein [Prescottella agglutinans]|uniref:oxygenase MpaB family protein n=1 Tax=Prescottella agglutinans TaxID=1644129 RepID=UPI0024751A2F|nr:oxygenase MpaB family protein [Prescottella agglutinans]
MARAGDLRAGSAGALVSVVVSEGGRRGVARIDRSRLPEPILAGAPRRFMLSPAWARRAGTPIRRFIRIDAEPTPDDLAFVAEALTRCDDAGDALAAAITQDRTVTMKQSRTALADGIGAVPDAPEALRTFFDAIERKPDWVDDALMRRGAEVCRRGGVNSLDVLGSALLAGYRSSATTDLLVRTGRLNGDGARRRVGETVKRWYECVQPGGMDRDGQGWQLTVHVRLMHAMINRHYARSDDWSVADWGLPINQADQSATYELFCSFYLMGMRSLGMPISRDDGRAVMHLWRYIGWLMGVDDRFLALDEQDGRRKLYHVLLTSPAPDEHAVTLARALVDSRLTLDYGRLRTLRRRFQYQKIRSVSAAHIGRVGLAELGLGFALPWYAAVRIPANFVKHTAARIVPGGSGWLLRRSEREQYRGMMRHFPGERAEVARHP